MLSILKWTMWVFLWSNKNHTHLILILPIAMKTTPGYSRCLLSGERGFGVRWTRLFLDANQLCTWMFPPFIFAFVDERSGIVFVKFLFVLSLHMYIHIWFFTTIPCAYSFMWFVHFNWLIEATRWGINLIRNSYHKHFGVTPLMN